jgi:hypothetical protein
MGSRFAGLLPWYGWVIIKSWWRIAWDSCATVTVPPHGQPAFVTPARCTGAFQSSANLFIPAQAGIQFFTNLKAQLVTRTSPASGHPYRDVVLVILSFFPSRALNSVFITPNPLPD